MTMLQRPPQPLPPYQHGGFLKQPNLTSSVDNQEYLTECAELIGEHKIEIDEEKILDLLQIKYRWPEQSLEVINHCGMVSNDFFDVKGYLIYDRWKRLYDLGFTSLLNNVLDLTSQLRDLNNKLLAIKGSETNANFYLSKGTETRRPSFDPHNHDYHVVVKPIYGSCTWVVNGKKHEAVEDSVLVIPAFSEHSVISNKEPRLSLTINLTG